MEFGGDSISVWVLLNDWVRLMEGLSDLEAMGECCVGGVYGIRTTVVYIECCNWSCRGGSRLLREPHSRMQSIKD